MQIIVALFVLAIFCPALTLAQVASPPQPAGVVTNLAGVASVVRLAAAEPSRLQFKDPVYAGDMISTAADSIVRVLLGGKALITIREFSNFTITEEPNRSTVNLASGSVTLAVARQRMKPGEQVDVRTPNAIAAVRGTVLLVEVESPVAAAGGSGGEQSVSTFSVLKGSVEVSCAAAGCSGSKIVHAFEAVRVSGLQMGAVEPISQTKAASLAGRFHVPLQPMDSSDDNNRKKTAKREMSKAMALAKVLAPNSVGAQATEGEAKQSSTAKADGNAAAAPGQIGSHGDAALANASFSVSTQAAEGEAKQPSSAAAGGNAAAAPGQTGSHGDAALVSASSPLVSSSGSTIAASATALVPTSVRQQSQSQTLLPGSGAGPAPLLTEAATERGSSGSGNSNSSFSQRAQERRHSRR
ncbi:MAG: FecR domain-containing protein [Nitrospirae bacterium]|nr:FecR domain-containing protein [Nitrospirota bacterium]